MGGWTMAASELDVNLNSMSEQSDSWSLGCDITIEDIDAVIKEIKVNDIVLTGNVSTEVLSVDLSSDTEVIDLDVNVVIDGLNSSILESQVVPYDKILAITDLSKEATSEKRYASSAYASKKIYDLISALYPRVEILENRPTGGGGGGDIDSEILDAIFTRIENIEDFTRLFYYDDASQTVGTIYNLFSEKEISAFGINTGSGSGGGGLIRTVLSASNLGYVESEDNSTTFSAYAIDSIYKKVLELEKTGPSADLSNYYTKTETERIFTTKEEFNAFKNSLGDSLWKIDENTGELYTDKQVRIDNNLYSTKEISAFGLNTGSGAGGIITTILDEYMLGTTVERDNKTVFNAYATNQIWNKVTELEDEIAGLAPTKVSVTQNLTSGVKIGSITVDGRVTDLFAPQGGGSIDGYATEAWVSDNFLSQSGGTINGDLRLKHGNYGSKLNFGDGNYCYIYEDEDDHLIIHASKGINLTTSTGYDVTINGEEIGSGSDVSLDGYATEAWVEDYFLSKSGGAISGDLSVSGDMNCNDIIIGQGCKIKFSTGGGYKTLGFNSSSNAFEFTGNVNASGEVSAYTING